MTGLGPIPQDPTVYGAPGYGASGDSGGQAALHAEEARQDWIFTFGADHTHPDTGQRLGRNYVRIHGTCDSTREVMLQAFGNRWSHQYVSEERAGVEKYGLTEVPMPVRGFDITDDETHHDIGPVEEHTGDGDVQAEVLAEVEKLHELVALYMPQFGDVRSNAFTRLDRIVALVRGEQR